MQARSLIRLGAVRAFSTGASSISGPPSVILLGGLGMTARHLEKSAAALYPGARAQVITHTLNDIVNVNYRFPANTAQLAAALEPGAAGPGGAIVHVFSGSAFFVVFALQKWAGAGPSARIRGLVLDSVPYLRVERELMKAAKVPRLLWPVATALASRLLVSPLFGATVERTDAYNVAQLDPRIGAPSHRVLVAHSADDEIVPVGQFREYTDALRQTPGWRVRQAGDADPAGSATAASAPSAVDVLTFEGRGRHAAMVRDDPAYIAAVQAFAGSITG